MATRKTMCELRPADHLLRIRHISPALYDALADIYSGLTVAEIRPEYPFLVGVTMDYALMVSHVMPYAADRQDFLSKYTDQIASLLGRNPLPEWFATGFGYGFPFTADAFATLFIQWALYVCVELAVSLR